MSPLSPRRRYAYSSPAYVPPRRSRAFSGLDWSWQAVLGAIAVLAVAIACGYLVWDCSGGRREKLGCRVLDKYKVAARTEVETYTDADGNRQVRTNHHPEQWRLILDLPMGEGTKDSRVSRAEWSRATVGSIHVLRCWRGRSGRLYC